MRKNGFQTPFHPLQVTSWIFFAFFVVGFHVIFRPALPSDVIVRTACEVVHILLTVVVVFFAARATSINASTSHSLVSFRNLTFLFLCSFRFHRTVFASAVRLNPMSLGLPTRSRSCMSGGRPGKACQRGSQRAREAARHAAAGMKSLGERSRICVESGLLGPTFTSKHADAGGTHINHKPPDPARWPIGKQPNRNPTAT